MKAEYYTKCDQIPLSKFIDMYTGNLSALIIRGNPPVDELRNAASLLTEEYCSIIGSKNMTFEIDNQAKMMKYSSRILLADTATFLIKYELYDELKETFKYLGIKMPEAFSRETIPSIVKSLESAKGEAKLRLEMLKKGSGTKKKTKESQADFTKERMMVCAHFKMHIDPKVFTTAEYGNLLKMMLNELKEVRNYGK